MNEYFILNMLSDIEKGILTVKPLKNPEDVYCGGIPFKVSNGYTIVVFDDCDDFDYISLIISPDGVEFDPWDYEYEYEKVRNYRPDDNICKDIYKILRYNSR